MSRLTNDSQDFCRRMLAETGIALRSCEAQGAIATPGALLGEALVERLRAHAEISFAPE